MDIQKDFEELKKGVVVRNKQHRQNKSRVRFYRKMGRTVLRHS